MARSMSAKMTLSIEVAVMEGLCEEASNALDTVNNRIGLRSDLQTSEMSLILHVYRSTPRT